MSREAKEKKVATSELDVSNKEIQEALAKNDEDWMKRMLLLTMTMIIALLGMD